MGSQPRKPYSILASKMLHKPSRNYACLIRFAIYCGQYKHIYITYLVLLFYKVKSKKIFYKYLKADLSHANCLQLSLYYANQAHTGAAEPGGNGGMCPPPPPLFLKAKKVPFFLGLNAPFKERKSIS
jgi:hypothetical protein